MPLCNCVNLWHLFCGNTLITSLEPIICLEKFYTLYYWSNQLETPPNILIENFLKRFASNNTVFTCYACK